MSVALDAIPRGIGHTPDLAPKKKRVATASSDIDARAHTFFRWRATVPTGPCVVIVCAVGGTVGERSLR
jgi:hypothetical protein